MQLSRAPSVICGVFFALVPLYPAFITLAGVSPPGVSVLPPAATLGLFALCAALDVVLLAALLRRPRTRVPLLGPLTAWLLAALAAAAFGFAPAAGLVFLLIFALSVVWHAGIVRFCSEPQAQAFVYWCIAISCTAASAAAVIMALTRTPANLYAVGHGRAIGPFVLPGELAGYLIVVLPLMAALVQIAPRRALRWTAAAALACGLAAFVLTFSRAGWIGMAAAGACYVAWTSTERRRYAPFIAAAGVLAVLALFNVRHNPAENFTRISIWQAALEMIRRFPLTGAGPFDFARIYPLVRVPGGDVQAFHAHNVILTIFAETGIIGLCAMLWVWWRFVAELRARLARAGRKQSVLALALAAGLAGTWVQGLIDTVSVVIFGLWLPVMALALAAAGSQTKERT